LNAFAASAIGDAFMQLSAKSTDPNGKNCKRKSLFAIAKVFAVCGLFHHVSPLKGLENLTPVVAWLDALLKSWGRNLVCVSRVAPTSSVRVAMHDDMTELPIALCHSDL
jgi:hypothetical protein